MESLARGIEELKQKTSRLSKSPPPKLHELYSLDKSEHPRRPGRDPCMNYLRFGNCKFGMHCQFDHPARVKSSDDQVLDELKNVERYSADECDESQLEKVRIALSTMNYISGVIDQIFAKAATDKVTGKRFIDSDTSYAILEAVKRLLSTDIKLLLNEVSGLSDRQGSDSWLRYGFVIHALCVHLPNLGQAVVMALKHADMEATLIEAVHECFEDVRKELLEVENEAYARGFTLDPEHVTVKELLQQTETSILKNAYQHSSAMAAAAEGRVEALNQVKAKLDSVEFFVEKGISLKIEPFGSCANTVGTLKSDLDLIVSFYRGEENDSALNEEQLDALGVSNEDIMLMFMEALGLQEEEESTDKESSSSLFRLKDFRPSARVPVIKFFYLPIDLELDLILFHCNDFALLNTQLIRDYCAADPRLRPLEFALKRWVSARGVGDSTNSTLSSYCWMLMMIFYLQQVDRSTLRLTLPGEADSAGEGEGEVGREKGGSSTSRFLSNLQWETGDGQEGYTLRPQPDLTTIYAEVMESMPCDDHGRWRAGVVESLGLGPGAEQGGLVHLLLGFFLYYGTEAGAAFGFYDNIACMRRGQSVPKPHVIREWKLHTGPGGGDEGVGGTVFETPTKAAGEPVMLSLADLEKELLRVKLGGGESTEERDDGRVQVDTVRVSTPDAARSPPSRSPRAIPSTPQPFNYKDTPSKMRELLEKPVPKPKGGAFPDVLDSAKQWQISVEDPFELSHDLGSVVRSVVGQIHIRSELRRAAHILSIALKAEGAGAGAGAGAGVSADLFDRLCEPNQDVPQLPFLCSLCGQTGHRERQCSLFVCHRCGQQGHSVRDCKMEKQAYCFICSKHGHVKKDCPTLICHKCGAKGHKANKCPLGGRRSQGEGGNGGRRRNGARGGGRSQGGKK